mgnify:CR=1 FL=1
MDSYCTPEFARVRVASLKAKLVIYYAHSEIGVNAPCTVAPHTVLALFIVLLYTEENKNSKQLSF